MKIGIFGGTFDPIHQGHILLAQEAVRQCQLDKVLFVPAFIPPHKSSRRDMTPAPYRYRMVELAIRNQPQFELCDIELNRPDISYTIDTLEQLKIKYPNDELFLIMGADAFVDFEHWKDPDRILQLAKVLVAPRPNQMIAGKYKDQILKLEMQECPINSTDIRTHIISGKKPLSVVNSDVLAYIERMNLYRDQSSCQK